MYKIALLACALLPCVSSVHAQQKSTPLEKSVAVLEALRLRQMYLRDDTRIDGCSVRRATGDSAYLSRMDSTIRSLITPESQVSCQEKNRGVGAYVQVESVGNDGSGASASLATVYVFVIVKNTGRGDLPQLIRPYAKTIELRRALFSDRATPIPPK